MSELEKIAKQALESIQSVDDFIDNNIKDVKDLTDTAGDLLKPVKAFQSIRTYVRKRRFQTFVKEYSKQISKGQNSGDSEQDLKRLKRYLKHDRVLEFLHNTVEAAIQANSVHCAALLGAYSGDILNNGITITYREIITLDALRVMNDFELESLVRIYRVADLAKPVRVSDYKERLGSGVFIIEKAIHKLKSVGLFEESESGKFDSKSGWGTFVSTEMAEDIWTLAESMGIAEEVTGKPTPDGIGPFQKP